MNKKAQYVTAVKMIIYAIFLTIVLLTLWGMSQQYVKQKTDLRGVEAELFASQLLYAPYGIVKQDVETLRPQMLIIDPARITSDHLNKAFKFDNNKIIAAKVTLTDKDGKQLAEGIYNEVWYNRWKPISGSLLKGSGTASNVTKKIIVGLDNEKIEKALLTIDILVPDRT